MIIRNNARKFTLFIKSIVRAMARSGAQYGCISTRFRADSTRFRSILRLIAIGFGRADAAPLARMAQRPAVSKTSLSKAKVRIPSGAPFQPEYDWRRGRIAGRCLRGATMVIDDIFTPHDDLGGVNLPSGGLGRRHHVRFQRRFRHLPQTHATRLHWPV